MVICVKKLTSKADVIVANILAHILVKLLDDISKFIKTDGIFYWLWNN